jgi:hypothetical protein
MCYTFSSKLGPEVHGSAEMFQIDIRAFSAVFFFFFLNVKSVSLSTLPNLQLTPWNIEISSKVFEVC